MLARTWHLLPVTLWCLILLCTFSCGSKGEYAGLYKSQVAESTRQPEIELKEDGEGIWRIEDNEESFTWYVKGGEIRLNTKQGGVIVAKIKDNTLEIVLPGRKKMSLKKVD
jgi:hypothetical protein